MKKKDRVVWTTPSGNPGAGVLLEDVAGDWVIVASDHRVDELRVVTYLPVSWLAPEPAKS